MGSFGILAAVLLGVAFAIWIWRYFRGISRHRRGDEYAVVEPAEATIDPYLYVYVNQDGSARELHPDERSYLETYFSCPP